MKRNKYGKSDIFVACSNVHSKYHNDNIHRKDYLTCQGRQWSKDIHKKLLFCSSISNICEEIMYTFRFRILEITRLDKPVTEEELYDILCIHILQKIDAIAPDHKLKDRKHSIKKVMQITRDIIWKDLHNALSKLQPPY